jgi:hypothetical protein
VTLGRLFLAWLPVAVVFVVIGGLEPANEWTTPEKLWMFTKWDVLWRSLEAAAVTLFASLWFDSLGHGGWWLLFLLLGLIVSLAHLQRVPTSPRRMALIRASRDVVRYVLAGAILAWRLG